MTPGNVPIWHWSRCGRLALDEDGILWQWLDKPGRAGWLYLGPITDADVPDDLVYEAWGLLDLWEDANRDKRWPHE